MCRFCDPVREYKCVRCTAVVCADAKRQCDTCGKPLCPPCRAALRDRDCAACEMATAKLDRRIAEIVRANG